MVNQFIHQVNGSFKLFLENEILSKGQAFRNNSGELYYVQDPRIPDSGTYSNPYGQWVYDSSISGADIPSGVYLDGVFCPRGTSGLVLDFNGRAIFPTKRTETVTAAYAVKDFNLYSTARSEEQLLFNKHIQFGQQFGLPAVSGLPPIGDIAPCIYIKQTNSRNEPFAFGGQDLSTYNYRAIVMGRNEYTIDGVGQIMQDLNDRVCLLLNNSPVNRYGDIVSGYYNYYDEVAANYDENNLLYIDASFDRVAADMPNKIELDLFIGVAEFSLKIARFPRVFT